MENKLTVCGKTYSDAAAEGNMLLQSSCFFSEALVADTLSVDTLTAIVQDADQNLDLLSRYGQPLEYYRGEQLLARMYLEKKITRIGTRSYKISCVSGVGLLLTDWHYGGIYTGQTAATVIAEIIGGIVPYTLDETLGQTALYGWLPKATRRDNLRDVLFAIGGQIRKDTAGEITIVPQTAGTPYEITADEFYMGGSVTGGNPATGIDLTEHSFVALPTNETVTLFDGAVATDTITTPMGAVVDGSLVEFSEPVHDLQVENGIILESGPNYAVLGQSPSALLTGKKYAHTQRVISRRQETGGTPNVLKSSACTLVNLMNAELVADRLMAYYGAAKTIDTDMVVTDQRPGDAVVFTDPFGDQTTGYIVDMEMAISATVKSVTRIVSGYVPTASGNYYSHVAILQGSGSWTVPPECKGKIRVVAIGGGDGGGRGNAGEAGGRASASPAYGSSGEGGLPGVPGDGGKVYVATLSVSAGNSFAFSIGSGGKGATASTDAEAGEATTFGSISSAEGFSSTSGFVELFSGDVYGLIGVEGLSGGKGNTMNEDEETVIYNGVTYVPGQKGANGEYDIYIGWGGYGGGAAAGRNGNDGYDGDAYYNGGNPFAAGGDGGAGATPVKAPNGAVPGQGGGAGHGGGGGGGGGPAKGSSSSYQWQGGGGDGGQPGAGGDGADGILLIYY